MSATDKAILLDNDVIVKYDKILLSTGATPRRLPFMTEELKDQVTTYRTVRKIEREIERERNRERQNEI